MEFEKIQSGLVINLNYLVIILVIGFKDFYNGGYKLVKMAKIDKLWKMQVHRSSKSQAYKIIITPDCKFHYYYSNNPSPYKFLYNILYNTFIRRFLSPLSLNNVLKSCFLDVNGIQQILMINLFWFYLIKINRLIN